MGDVQNWVIIGTKLDSKQLTKDLNNQRRELQKYEKETEELLKQKAKLEIDLQPYEEELALIHEMADDLLSKAQTENEVNNVLELENKNIDQLNEKYSLQIEQYDMINEKIKANALNQEMLKTKITQTQDAIKQAHFTEGFDKIGKSIDRVVKKVGRWALAIFGIRGAYMAVRNAINVISRDDQQLKADIDYMKNAFAYTLEPIVRAIVNLAKELMYAIQYIAYVLTGKNIFANANKSLASANKNAQALKKTMAGFDEMNVLSDSGGGDSGGMPSFDLSKMNEMSETGKGLVGVIMAIAGALGLLKLSELLEKLGLISEALGFSQAFGIGLILLSLYNIIMDIIGIWEKFDSDVEGNNTTLKDWGDVLTWVGVGIVGIGLLIGGLPVIVAGAIIGIVALIMKYWDDIKKFFTEKVFDWLDRQIEKLEKTTFGSFIANILKEVKLKIAQVIGFLDDLFNRIKRLFDGITKLFKGDSSGWRDIFGALLNGIIRKLNSFINGMNSMIAKGGDLLSGLGKIFGADWNIHARIPNIPYLAKGGIINMPSRGVPIGSAMVGEHGAEGVIPLTDSTQMALLGEAIGKYININATVPVYVGNRLVARELKKINAEDNFAFNR